MSLTEVYSLSLLDALPILTVLTSATGSTANGSFTTGSTGTLTLDGEGISTPGPTRHTATALPPNQENMIVSTTPSCGALTPTLAATIGSLTTSLTTTSPPS